MYKNLFKPICDWIAALVLLFISLPLFFVLIPLLWLTQRQVFFVQTRIGYQNQPFNLIKFCTMRNAFDANGTLLSDMQRITPLGKFLRYTSLDELPQLVNVLRGEMSLVGTRPLLPEYLPLYNEFQLRRHEVRPGITGLAQIKGRNQISWQKRFELDVYYVDNQSFFLDLYILGLTFLRLFKPQGINANSDQTMEKFQGNSV
ncbi:MAG: sugar transferase [Microscillaceae bacterium]|nr:sugar transferase [Microscillaceae bacterium]